MVQRMAVLITDDFKPSTDTVKHLKNEGYADKFIERERIEFILYWKEAGKKFKMPNKAFRNWIKNAVKFGKNDEQAEKKGSQSFKQYQPVIPANSSRSAGREALNKLRGKP